MRVIWNELNKDFAYDYGEGPFDVISEGEADSTAFYMIETKVGIHNFFSFRFDVIPDQLVNLDELV